ncbi:MAG: serine hydrolase domain-containing protein [Chloroflexota bacterium]
MTDAQARVQALLDELTGTGAEQGLQVAAYHHGALVVDAWSGVADPATGRRVDGDTLFTVFSTTKGITATVIHLLADRGLLDYDVPIARYWPEFAARGKERVTLRQALTHTSCIPQVPAGVTPEAMCDWDGMCRATADLTPLWEPGTVSCYHAFTYGWILGEVARRVDGRPFDQIVREEICAPLGITSLYLGIPDAAEPAVAPMEADPTVPEAPAAALPSSTDPLAPEALWARIFPPALLPLHHVFNRPDVRRACIPAAGGIMNARAVARHYAALASGEVDGVRLLTARRIAGASAVQTSAPDVLTGQPWPRSLGYWPMGNPLSPTRGGRTVVGHSGAGGSLGLADSTYGFAFGLTKNRMVDSLPGEGTADRVLAATVTALGLPPIN